MVRHLPPGTPVEIILNAGYGRPGHRRTTTVTSRSRSPFPRKTAKPRSTPTSSSTSATSCTRSSSSIATRAAVADRRGLRSPRGRRPLLGPPRQHARRRPGAADADAAAVRRELHAAQAADAEEAAEEGRRTARASRCPKGLMMFAGLAGSAKLRDFEAIQCGNVDLFDGRHRASLTGSGPPTG